ncbi:MAG: HNH endonuclease [Rickettsiaceae bacterium]|nr:HNH endonuclease [Rickettsiaceae bacterium]
MSKGSLVERFGRYAYFDGSCWYWQGARNSQGYGVISKGTRKQGNVKAHRASYEIFNFQQISNKQCVCHHCDNPACVNPHHLFLGSQQDNVLDMVKKGRHKLPPIKQGEDSSKAKLKEIEVRKIRKMSDLGFSSRVLARDFKVSKTTILQIINRKSWKHI